MVRRHYEVSGNQRNKQDLAALEMLGLVQRDEIDTVSIPFETVEIHLGLAVAA